MVTVPHKMVTLKGLTVHGEISMCTYICISITIETVGVGSWMQSKLNQITIDVHIIAVKGQPTHTHTHVYRGGRW